MTSTDLIITINGQEFILSGSEIKRSSTDERGEVLRRLDGIEQGQAEILQRLDGLENQLMMVQHDQADLSTFMYWILGAIGIFLASGTLPSILASISRKGGTQADDDKMNLTISINGESVPAAQND